MHRRRRRVRAGRAFSAHLAVEARATRRTAHALALPQPPRGRAAAAMRAARARRSAVVLDAALVPRRPSRRQLRGGTLRRREFKQARIAGGAATSSAAAACGRRGDRAAPELLGRPPRSPRAARRWAHASLRGNPPRLAPTVPPRSDSHRHASAAAAPARAWRSSVRRSRRRRAAPCSAAATPAAPACARGPREDPLHQRARMLRACCEDMPPRLHGVGQCRSPRRVRGRRRRPPRLLLGRGDRRPHAPSPGGGRRRPAGDGGAACRKASSRRQGVQRSGARALAAMARRMPPQRRSRRRGLRRERRARRWRAGRGRSSRAAVLAPVPQGDEPRSVFENQGMACRGVGVVERRLPTRRRRLRLLLTRRSPTAGVRGHCVRSTRKARSRLDARSGHGAQRARCGGGGGGGDSSVL